MKCDCFIEDEYYRPYIIHCPLHKAAEDMYVALKNLLDVVRRGEPQWQERLKAKEALSKAEGK